MLRRLHGPSLELDRDYQELNVQQLTVDGDYLEHITEYWVFLLMLILIGTLTHKISKRLHGSSKTGMTLSNYGHIQDDIQLLPPLTLDSSLSVLFDYCDVGFGKLNESHLDCIQK